MSESNDLDSLMEENKPKETNLQKFLKSLDRDAVYKMESFVKKTKPLSNHKGEKIKLFHDVTMILKFKAAEKKFEKGGKKIIDELCIELKNLFGFSVATLRERIQKKLSHISKQNLLDHIELGLDFSFDTKRKLLPIKNFRNNQINNSEIEIPSKEEESGKDSRILICSSDNNSDVEEVKENKDKGENTHHRAFPKKEISPKSNEQNDEKPKEVLYNEFRELDLNEQLLSEIEGIIFAKRKDNTYQITTLKIESETTELLEKFKIYSLTHKLSSNPENESHIESNHHVDSSSLEIIPPQRNSKSRSEDKEPMIEESLYSNSKEIQENSSNSKEIHQNESNSKEIHSNENNSKEIHSNENNSKDLEGNRIPEKFVYSREKILKLYTSNGDENHIGKVENDKEKFQSTSGQIKEFFERKGISRRIQEEIDVDEIQDERDEQQNIEKMTEVVEKVEEISSKIFEINSNDHHVANNNNRGQKNNVRSLNQNILHSKNLLEKITVESLEEKVLISLSSDSENEESPEKDEMFQFCSEKDWKKYNKNNKEFEYLKWHKDEDEYLKSTLKSESVTDAVNKLSVIKKYKHTDNIINRINFLKIKVHPIVIKKLAESR